MITRLVQQKVPIGSQVRFLLKNGREISGVLIEIGRDHITVENTEGSATILTEMIGSWEVIEKPEKKDTEDALESISKGDDEVERDTQVQHEEPSEIYGRTLKKLIEIEAYNKTRLQNAKIELKSPDFIIPTDKIKRWQDSDAPVVWDRIKNRYAYAQKVNELSSKFGRIQPITTELKQLSERFPAVIELKRHLAYFYFLSGKREEAIQCYQEIAISSQDVQDLFNLSVLALQVGKGELACYSLEHVFHKVSIIEEIDAWYVYVKLLKKFSNFPVLASLSETPERELSEDEFVILLETAIYILKSTDEEQRATEFVQRWIEGQPPKILAIEILKQLKGGELSESYLQVVKQFMDAEKGRKRTTERQETQHPQGYIYTYMKDRSFGFLRDLSGEKYFFHRSAIIDEFLFSKLTGLVRGEQIPVVFETTRGPKGPIAIQISLHRTIDELFELSTDYADNGDYPKAIAQIKRVLRLDSNYLNAQELYEKWRDYVRVTGVPRGSNPYARAKRVQLVEKDLERAAQLLREAIARNDNVESAIKDLATLLVQLGRPEEAIDVLEQNRKKIRDQQSLGNLFINIYQSAGQHDQSIALLQNNLDRASSNEKKAQILWQIANSYLRKEDYSQAEKKFREVLRLRPDNRSAQRNIGLCLIKQERYKEAEKILNEILDISPDAKAAELLEAITQAKLTGRSAEVDIVIETALSDLSGELSGFTRFFLDRCEFQIVAPERIKKDENCLTKYEGSERDAHFDLNRLDEFAKQLGTRRPRDRAGCYLSAARIIMERQDDHKKFYQYLCRSFASIGDATIVENRLLDTAQEWYCEALSIYDGVRSRRKDEQDAVNALVRFLFSILGQTQIPITPKIPSIDETIEEVINRHPQRDRVFDAIAYLILRSRYAANRLLNRLYAKTTLQAMALEYLKTRDILVPEHVKNLDDFVCLWNELRRKKFDEIRSISSELRFIAKVELTTAWLGNGIKRVKSIEHSLFFDLDRRRVSQLRMILEIALEFCKQVSFEEQERLCIQIDSRCKDLLGEIEESPTKLSIEEIFSVIGVIQKKVKERLEELYESSEPQLTFRLPIESYTPDNDLKIEVQIVVANKIGRSPAESLELIIQEDEDLFKVNIPEIKLDESLRGGDHPILEVPLVVTDQALRSRTFSLPVYAQYRTRSNEITQTPVGNFSIRLYSETDFEEIENPYASYAEGGIVGDPSMFYGRKELIQNITNSIKKSYAQSKSIIVFGQKRAGKSSILHHLKNNLEKEKDLLVLDIGNIGSILDEHSSAPFLYQILWSILKELRDVIEDRVEAGFSFLNLSFPSDREFYAHPSPLIAFKDIFDKFRRISSKHDSWRNMRIIVLIDEFSYIYGLIVSGKIPELFMKNWKALLQENYFNVVMAGQDVMPKFKQYFPNELATTQDERVSYLKHEDAVKLIDEPIRIGGRHGENRYREQAIERIIYLTAGSPFYIQIICSRLVEYMNRKRAPLVTYADVEHVKNELIQGVNALSLDKFDNLINSGDTTKDAITDEDAIKVLTAIAVNSQSGHCNQNSIVCETALPVDFILDNLVERDVIEREREQYYQILVGLFKEWLIANK